jgi:hypothetical protein
MTIEQSLSEHRAKQRPAKRPTSKTDDKPTGQPYADFALTFLSNLNRMLSAQLTTHTPTK